MAKIRKVTKKTSDLKRYENNPRRNDKAIKAVVESIKKFGITNLIIINQDNVILSGHTRLGAMEQLGIEKVDCLMASDLTEDQEKAFRIADNRVGELSEWDKDLLEAEIKAVGADDWENFGFKVKDLAFLEPPENCTCPKCGKTFQKV